MSSLLHDLPNIGGYLTCLNMNNHHIISRASRYNAHSSVDNRDCPVQVMPNSWNLTSRNFSKKSNIEHKSQPVDVDGSCSKILFNPNRSEVKSSSFQSNRSAPPGHIQRSAALQKKPVVFSLKRTADTLLPHKTLDRDLPVARPSKILRTNGVTKIGATNDIVESSDRKTLPALQHNLKRKS